MMKIQKRMLIEIIGFFFYLLSEELSFIPVIVLKPDLDCQLIRNREEVVLFIDSSY